jgi:hypothetical protein
LYWFRKVNGQCTSWQSMSISISKDGHVSGFMDSLAVFHIATAAVNVSKADAINITIPYARAYAEKRGQEVVWENATLDWNRDLDSVRGDDLAVYPEWNVVVLY